MTIRFDIDSINWSDPTIPPIPHIQYIQLPPLIYLNIDTIEELFNTKPQAINYCAIVKENNSTYVTVSAYNTLYWVKLE